MYFMNATLKCSMWTEASDAENAVPAMVQFRTCEDVQGIVGAVACPEQLVPADGDRRGRLQEGAIPVVQQPICGHNLLESRRPDLEWHQKWGMPAKIDSAQNQYHIYSTPTEPKNRHLSTPPHSWTHSPCFHEACKASSIRKRDTKNAGTCTRRATIRKRSYRRTSQTR